MEFATKVLSRTRSPNFEQKVIISHSVWGCTCLWLKNQRCNLGLSKVTQKEGFLVLQITFYYIYKTGLDLIRHLLTPTLFFALETKINLMNFEAGYTVIFGQFILNFYFTLHLYFPQNSLMFENYSKCRICILAFFTNFQKSKPSSLRSQC